MDSFWTARRMQREQREREREQAHQMKIQREDEIRRRMSIPEDEHALRVREDVRDRRARAFARWNR